MTAKMNVRAVNEERKVRSLWFSKLLYRMNVSLAADKKDMGIAEWIPPLPVYSCDHGKKLLCRTHHYL